MHPPAPTLGPPILRALAVEVLYPINTKRRGVAQGGPARVASGAYLEAPKHLERDATLLGERLEARRLNGRLRLLKAETASQIPRATTPSAGVAAPDGLVGVPSRRRVGIAIRME